MIRPIPIAIALTSFDPGGTERQMTELIARLDPTRYEVHAVCLRREGHWLPKVERAAASIAEFRVRGFASASMGRELAAFAFWCRRNQIAVVHACDFYTNVFALAGAALGRVPVRIGSRRDILLPGRSDHQHRLQRYAYRLAHHVVANSRAAAMQLAEEGVPEARVSVIPNGIDLSRYTSAAAKAAVDNPSHPRTITTVANLRPEKGHEILLEAAALVCATHPDVRFQIVGDGSERNAREQQARELGIADRVAFLGHREDVPELLAASDLYVLPSRTEAFPNGVIEAMAAALPAIASNVGGIPELIQDDRNGLLVAPGDAARLASAISSLLDDPARAARLAGAARATVESRFGFERMVGAFDDLYSSLLAGSGLPIRAICVG